ncbi:MAG: SUMF1/EgtB/PvdO family nonheme iron enzyme [Granulosicoccus sp.]
MADATYDIFIAYKREDRPTANQLLALFESQGFSVFIDTSIHAGSHFGKALEQALDASRTVVVLWSEKSKESFYVIDEAEEGRDRGVLFPALIEDTKIPYGFRQIQTVNLVDWDGDSSHSQCNTLLDALRARLQNDESVVRTTGDGMPPGSDGTNTSSSEETQPPEARTPNRQKPASDRQFTRKPGDTYRDTLEDGSQGPAMVIIPAGRYLMGSPDGEGHEDEHPQHEVVIPAPFSMGQYAVSFAEFDAFCEATGRDAIKDAFGRDKQPVINVSWHDAVAYCQWLSTMSGQDYCLPSEARWEYACRAGTTTPWNTGTKLGTDQANFARTHSETVPVDQYAPNDFGLYQMHGNVWEWCQDAWQDDYKGAPTDGSAKDSRSNSTARALRGGSWINFDGNCRSSYRRSSHPDGRYYSIGFRVSCLSPIP